MAFNKKSSGRHSVYRTILRIVAVILSYLILLLGAKLVSEWLEPPPAEPAGALPEQLGEGALSLDYNGKTWVYRSRDLTNVLLVGRDWQEDSPETAATAENGAENGSETAAAAENGSPLSLLLLTVDREHQTVSALALDPFLLAPPEVAGGVRQTLASCWEASANATAPLTAAVCRLLCGVPLDGYLLLEREAVSVLNDKLGGVTVTVADDLSVLDEALTAGQTVTLSADQAQHFVCSSLGGATAQVQRQQTFMQQAMRGFFDRALTDPELALDIYDALTPHLQTDLDRAALLTQLWELYEGGCNYQELAPLTGTGGESGRLLDQDSLCQFLTANYFE